MVIDLNVCYEFSLNRFRPVQGDNGRKQSILVDNGRIQIWLIVQSVPLLVASFVATPVAISEWKLCKRRE